MSFQRMYVGTFTLNRSLPVGAEQGIFWYQFDPHSGRLTLENSADCGPNPAFLVLSGDGRFLYSVNEVSQEFRGHPGGGVSAFAVDPAGGGLTYLNSQPTLGGSPCFVSLDRTGKWLLVANYRGGSVLVYPLLADGSLGAHADFIQHSGQGPNSARQEGPHAHSIQMDPTNRLALAADLGLDQVKLYQLDPDGGKLALAGALQLHPGAGPRHLDFHPNGHWLYIVNELDSTLAFYQVDPDRGTFSHIQTVSTLPEGYSGEKWVADVHVHPEGRFVYVSNRAHDSLATFAIDPVDGRVELRAVVPSLGKTPRSFALDLSGRWLICAHQNSNNLVVFELNPQTGIPEPNGVEVIVPTPVCARFIQP